MAKVNKKNRREKMGAPDIIIKMSEGNQGAIKCMTQLINDAPIAGMVDISFLNSMGIRGARIYKLWNVCGKDVKKLQDTIQAFRDGRFSEAEIHANLSGVHAKPFI